MIKVDKARNRIIGEYKERILLWYMQFNPNGPETQCEDRKYNGEYFWWLEPLIPGEDNPMLHCHSLGDDWGLEIVIRQPVIRSVGGL
jgi:hypothetical protein